MSERIIDGLDPRIEEFLRLGLPSLLRRLAARRGGRRQTGEFVEEVAQELTVDLLSEPEAFERLSRDQRFTRWFTLAGHLHYQLLDRPWRRAQSLSLVAEEVPDPRSLRSELEDPVLRLSEPMRRRLLQLAEAGLILKNGRLNVTGTALRMKVRPAGLRALWSATATDLGFGIEYLDFWRRRLGEALLGLGADLLRDQGAVLAHDERCRPRPDPKGRLRRIRRIRAVLRVRPSVEPMRTLLGRYASLKTIGALQPSTVLRDAARVLVGDPRPQLWLAEAAMAERRVRDAALALRQARQCGAASVPVALARARLLEARDRLPQAISLLERVVRRSRGDTRVLASLAALVEEASTSGGTRNDALKASASSSSSL